MKFIKKLLTITVLLLGTSLSAVEFDLSVGMQDFVVANIQNDTPADGISSGTSHTVGLNVGIILKHTTSSNIHFLAKAEAFLDHDKDHLDPDHIPIWFAFLLDIDGPLHTINKNNTLKWYVLMDNKQNTVSCIERQVRQYVGIGYEFHKSDFTFDINAYAGFYYIELDDDTPSNRGYTRQDTDDGESSNVFEIQLAYNFTKNLALSGYLQRYSANAGLERLETDYELLFEYKNAGFITQDSAINFKVKHSDYSFDRFYRPSVGLPILPFDNDTLIQATLTIPLHY